MGLFSRRRYVAGTVPEDVEELDGPVVGAPPPSAYRRVPERPDGGPDAGELDGGIAPGEDPRAGGASFDGGDLDDVEDFYDDEDSEDRPGAPVGFLPVPPTRRPRRTGRGLGLGAVLFVVLILLARTIVGVLSGDGSARPSGWGDVPDIYADVAAEPERRLTAQDVPFLLLDHQPLGSRLCAGLDRCLAGAAAEWEVTGTPLQGRSWYLVFEDAAAADAAAGAGPVLADVFRGIGPNWAVRAGSPGRFVAVGGVGPADGTTGDLRQDPFAVEAADALRIFSTSPAVAEIWHG